MREFETSNEQAGEFVALRLAVEAFLNGAKKASPGELQKLRIAIESLTPKIPTASKVEVKELSPSGIEVFIEQWNRGEEYKGGEAAGDLWLVYTVGGEIFVLPNPSERNRYPGSNLLYYYRVDEGIKLGQQQLVRAAQIFSGKKESSFGFYEHVKKNPRAVLNFDITKGEFSS